MRRRAKERKQNTRHIHLLVGLRTEATQLTVSIHSNGIKSNKAKAKAKQSSMPDPGTIAASIEAGFRLNKPGSDVVDLTRESILKFPADYRRVYDHVRNLMKERSVLDEANNFELKRDADGGLVDPVRSPIIEGLCNLYTSSRGIIYVMFAPAGQGKTFGAKAFLNHFYRFKQEKGELRMSRDS